jgi:hypothetical protein
MEPSLPTFVARTVGADVHQQQLVAVADSNITTLMSGARQGKAVQ